MSDFSPISESRALQRLLCALATWREKTVLNTAVVAQVIVVGCLIAQSGCIGYQVGAGSLYAPDVATVYVPMIESDSYRRDLGERLTEAVCKEIELKTPYKVVSTPDADSILSVRLITDTRRTLVKNAFDDPRVAETDIRTHVTWLNRRRLPIAPAQVIPLPPEMIAMNATSNIIPEAGQSVATSQQQAIQRLAQQIVGTMEAPW